MKMKCILSKEELNTIIINDLYQRGYLIDKKTIKHRIIDKDDCREYDGVEFNMEIMDIAISESGSKSIEND